MNEVPYFLPEIDLPEGATEDLEDIAVRLLISRRKLQLRGDE